VPLFLGAAVVLLLLALVFARLLKRRTGASG